MRNADAEWFLTLTLPVVVQLFFRNCTLKFSHWQFSTICILPMACGWFGDLETQWSHGTGWHGKGKITKSDRKLSLHYSRPIQWLKWGGSAPLLPFEPPCNSMELWTFRSQDHSLPGAKVPGVELSLPGTFAPWNFRSMELSHPGTFAPWNFRTLGFLLLGTFAPTNECSKER